MLESTDHNEDAASALFDLENGLPVTRGWYRIDVTGVSERERFELRLDFGLGFVGHHSLFAFSQYGKARLFVRLFKRLRAVQLVRSFSTDGKSRPRINFEKVGMVDLWSRRTWEQVCLLAKSFKRQKSPSVHDRPRRLWRSKGLQAFPAELAASGDSSYELWRGLPAHRALILQEPTDHWLLVMDCRVSEPAPSCLEAFETAAEHAGAKICILREGSLAAVRETAAHGCGWLLLVEPDVALDIECVRAFEAAAAAGKAAIFSDNDHRGEDRHRFHPEFRTKFSLERLKSEDWLGGAIAFRVETLKFDSGENATAYSLSQKIADAIGPSAFAHVPQVLYSRLRSPQLSIFRPLCPQEAWSGTATIIIPTRDNAELLGRCIESILTRTKNPAYEVIVHDNGSTDGEALRVLDQYGRHDNIRVVRDDLPFNFSRINNEAAAIATGEILIFLNNDTEIVSGDWIDRLAGVASQTEVGCVGPLLLQANGSIQHAGLVTGPGGIAGHVHAGLDPQYAGSAAPIVRRDVSAVTGACLAIEKKSLRMIRRIRFRWTSRCIQ